MIPWECLDRVDMPGNTEDLVLCRRGEEYSIRIGTAELMNSRSSGSEQALADVVGDRLGDCRTASFLIGGLGMGFTLAATLRRMGPDTGGGPSPATGTVVVAELVPAVLAWNQGPLGHLAGHPLRDSRVQVVVEDVGSVLRRERARFDAVLLDVDNGPGALTSASNAWLYEPAGMAAIFQALRPTGILAIWSVQSDPAFVERLRRAGYFAEELAVRGRGRRGGHHTIFLISRRHPPGQGRAPAPRTGSGTPSRRRP